MSLRADFHQGPPPLMENMGRIWAFFAGDEEARLKKMLDIDAGVNRCSSDRATPWPFFIGTMKLVLRGLTWNIVLTFLDDAFVQACTGTTGLAGSSLFKRTTTM